MAERIELLDVVELVEDLPQESLHAGQVGTVVEIYRGGEALEVEFSDREGETVTMVALARAHLRKLMR